MSLTASRQKLAHRVSILDEDPDLGGRLAPEEFRIVRRFATAEVVELARGLHHLSQVGNSELLGMLVLDGLLVRSVHVGERRCGEVVGPGTFLRPWSPDAETATVPFEVRWRAVSKMRLALLDDRLISIGARCPGLMHAIFDRSVERSQTLGLSLAIHCLQHVELRLLVLLWHLADRFGRVTRDGVIVPLRLSHGDLAELVGSQRPSVSSRLAGLRARGQVLRQPDRTWLLRGAPPAEVRDMRARAQAMPSVTVSAD